MGNQIHADTMIFGVTEDQAEKHMIELIEFSGEWIMKAHRRAIVTNRGKYFARVLNESSRGYRYLNMYISRELLLDEAYSELFLKVALPCLVPPHYYEMSKREQQYNWREHVFIY